MKKNLIYILLLLMTIQSRGQEIADLKNFRYGELENGVNYFIKHIESPQAATSMRFYVKAASYQEDPDQLEVAHLLEHMAFKPMENFPEGVKTEAKKMNIPHITGTTGRKSTRYIFDAPSRNEQAILMGLNWFKGIAVNLELSDKNLNQERGSVRQEFLYGSQGNLEKYYSKKNLEAKLFPCHKSKDSFLTHIQTVPKEILKRFYKDWYRPDLMGVVIVGNIKDMKATEQLIKSIFEDIPKPDHPRKKRNCDSLYFERPPQFFVEELKENRTSEGQKVKYQLFFRQPELAKNIGTKKGYKHYIAFQLLLGIMSERFHQKQIVSDLLFQPMAKNTYKFGEKPLSFALMFESKETSAEEAFQDVFIRFHQLRKYGVLEKEWNLAKEQYAENRVKENASYWHQQIWDYFAKDEALFAHKEEVLYRWVQDLSVNDFNTLIKQFLSPMPEDIGIIAPTGSKALQYTKKQVRSWIARGNQQPVGPYRMPETTEELMTSTEMHELKKSNYENLGLKKNGTQEIVLENGVKVVLRPYEPTPGIGDKNIMIHGFSKLGAACFSQEEYYSALNAPSIIEFTGAGRFSAAEITRFKEKANILNCLPYVDFKEAGIRGNASLGNIEELLQLVYLYFTPPKFDVQGFKDWQKTKRVAYQNGKNINDDFRNNIRHFFQDSVVPPTFGFRYLKSTEAYNSIPKTNGKKSYEIYRKIFGQPGNFTFILTGNFEIEQVLPLVQKYLGNLPQDSAKWICENKKKKKSMEEGPIYKEIVSDDYQMENVKYYLSYIQERNNNYSWKETLRIQVLGALADIMLKRLRYENGFALYNFWATGRYNPDEFRYKIDFDISCQVEELKPIRLECRKITEEIKRGEIKKEHFRQAVKKIRGRFAKSSLLRHRKMQKMLYEQLRYNHPWIALGKYDKFLQSVDVQDIIITANKYFKKGNRYEFVVSDQVLSNEIRN